MAQKIAAVREINVSLMPPDAERERERAFLQWLVSVDTSFLECRNGRHVSRGLTDPRTALSVKQGMCYVEAACPRCGTVLHSAINVDDGFLVGPHTRTSYEYPEGYLLPRAAVGPGGSAMDKSHRAQVRLELLERAMKAHGTSLGKEVTRDKREAGRETSRQAARNRASIKQNNTR